MFDMVLNMTLEITKATVSYYLAEGSYHPHVTSPLSPPHPFDLKVNRASSVLFFTL